jgi:hypothetical protein
VTHVKEILTHRRVKNLSIHPFALAIYPVLSLYAHNVGKGFLGEAITISIGVTLCTGLLWMLLNLFLRNSIKSAIITTTVVTILFFHGHAISAVAKMLEWLHIRDTAGFLIDAKSSLTIWLPLWGILLITVLWTVTRTKSDLRTANGYLNIVGLVLLVLLASSFVTAAVRTFAKPLPVTEASQSGVLPSTDGLAPGDGQSNHQSAEGRVCWHEGSVLPSPTAAPESLPDIYYLVADAYAGADVLQDIYQLDNSEFLAYLSDKGFYVAHESRSNYSQTALSLASSLNLNYLDTFMDQFDSRTDDRRPLHQMIQDNCLVRFLRAHGYTIIASATGYEPTELGKADLFLAPSSLLAPGSFEEALIALTPLAVFQKTWSDFRRDRILFALEHAADASETPGPAFVFIHVLAPHWPFIFAQDGTPIQPPRGQGLRTDYDYDEVVEGYRNQLLFVNELLRSSIDEILSRSTTPPIIIVQADHGPDAKLDPDWHIEGTDLRERMSILNALHLPGHAHDDLYAGITPVNTFRVILNQYFHADLELLADKAYFSRWDRPYVFTDVTELVGD